tara:strand:+ start:2482 stop:3969 length:1488 start_codon:yes stop_codon:yes gene_type:complete
MKDNLEIFYNFIKSNKHLFEKGNKEFSADKIMFQLAYEHAENSSVSKKAEDYFDQGRVNWPYIKQINRRKTASNKLFDLTAYEYTDLLGYYKGSDSLLLKKQEENYFLIDIASLTEKTISKENALNLMQRKDFAVKEPAILPKEDEKYSLMERSPEDFNTKRKEDLWIYAFLSVDNIIFYTVRDFNEYDDDSSLLRIWNTKTNSLRFFDAGIGWAPDFYIVGAFIVVEQSIYRLSDFLYNNYIPPIKDFHSVSGGFFSYDQDFQECSVFLQDKDSNFIWEESHEYIIQGSHKINEETIMTWDDKFLNVWDCKQKIKLFEWEFESDVLQTYTLSSDLIIFYLKHKGFDYFFNPNKLFDINIEMMYSQFKRIGLISGLKRVDNNRIIIKQLQKEQYFLYNVKLNTLEKTISEKEYSDSRWKSLPMKWHQDVYEKNRTTVDKIIHQKDFILEYNNESNKYNKIGITDGLPQKIYYENDLITILVNGKLNFYIKKNSLY